MNKSAYLKLIVFVPLEHAEKVRQAMHTAGAGQAGEYKDVSYTSEVVNRYIPQASANPEIGEVGEPQEVKEKRIEFLCPKEKLKVVILAMKKAHPYEEVAYDVLERLDV